ncbi:putative G-protein coupled receptor 176 [Oryzias melastigma]|uniref:Putative G-protein coupled receptor 176 n=1 Tax=Oryzias melastigma TaxID=30732 RepID=A0A834CAU7_ORYME|nr:putative G-protein coupled receptor 176 [Oryzias melastigma]
MDGPSRTSILGDGAVNFSAAHIWPDVMNASGPGGPWHGGAPAGDGGGIPRSLVLERAYRDFSSAVQVLVLVGSLLGNAVLLWCTCCTSVFKSVTGRFLKNLACSSIGAALVCIPFDVALGSSPPCCPWLQGGLLCKTLKFLHRLFCSASVLSFGAIALDRYYSVLYPLVRKLSDSRSRDLVVYIWVHAAVASLPVFAVASVTDVFAASSCSDGPSHSLGHMVYVLVYNLSTVALPLVLVLVLMLLVRRAISASQKKKVIIAALRTPQSSISIPYVSQREAELHASLLAAVLTFSACSAPYGALVVYRAVLADPVELSPSLYLTALWLPKLPLLTSPLLFLTINRSARHGWLGLLVRLQRRLSRRNAVSMGGRGSLEADSGGEEPAGLETAGRSGSQLLEMFNIGQQQIFRPEEEAEPKPLPQDAGSGSGSTEQRGGPEAVSPRPEAITEDSVPRTSPLHICTSSSQVAPATPTEPDDSPQFGFGPFELPPQWLPETRNSKKRLLPPLGNTPEELIQSKAPRPRPERRISRNNRVNTIPAVDP